MKMVKKNKSEASLVTRYKDDTLYKSLFFRKSGHIVSIDLEKVAEIGNNNGPIKLFDEDFVNINENVRRMTHFNIQQCGHQKGLNYLVFKIVEPGYFDNKIEQPPILDAHEFYLARCINVENCVDYEFLNDEHFTFSLNNIKNIDSLKSAILRRYEKSLAHISVEKKLSLGVSVTELEILNHYTVDLFSLIKK